MRHIYKIFPTQLCSNIQSSIENTKQRYHDLCSTGINVNNVNYMINIDDVSLLYRQATSNVTSLSEEECVCFAVAFGNVGLISLEDYSNKTRIVTISDEEINSLNGNISLDDSIRYVIVNPTSALTFSVSNTLSDIVQNYEVDITVGNTPVPIVFENIRWLGVEPSFESKKRYLIYIDGNIGVSTEL